MTPDTPPYLYGFEAGRIEKVWSAAAVDGLLAAITAERARADAAEAREGTLREALVKIADWDGIWEPWPENNEEWRAMAVVTARMAVKQDAALAQDTKVTP
jgi:hypothetical protein